MSEHEMSPGYAGRSEGAVLNEPHNYEESLKILESEEGQLNAVFACFGSAVQHAQFFEQALEEFLVALNKVDDSALTLEDLDDIAQGLRKRTMGGLLREVKKRITFGESWVDGELEDALNVRNFLMHRFFRERAHKLSREPGRFELLAELIEFERLLKRVTGIVGGMRVAMQEHVSHLAKNSFPPNDDGANALLTMQLIPQDVSLRRRLSN